MTFETRFIAGENEDRFVTLGQNFGQAFADVFATPTGDLNFDNSVDGDDWLILTANAQSDLSTLSTIDAYAAGDINGDGFNDVLDFGLFKEIYEQENGANSFALMLVSIPEPSTTCLAVMAVSLLTSCRGRSCRSTTLPSSTLIHTT